MRLDRHLGKLYAANGNWPDEHRKGLPREKVRSARTLRFEGPDAKRQFDLDTGLVHDRGGRHMKGNALKSVTLESPGRGHTVEDEDQMRQKRQEPSHRSRVLG